MKFKVFAEYFRVWIKWTILAALCGCLLGPIGASFVYLIEESTALRERYPLLILGLPIGGLVIVFLYKHSKLKGGGSTNSVFTAVRDNQIMPLVTAPLIYVSTVITHLFGGSSGREGAALQLGGSITGSLGKLLRLNTADCEIMTMCGMSAAFSAVFGTPITATIFALEVTNVGIMQYVALVPCIISALVGVMISSALGIKPTSFTLVGALDVSPLSMLQVIALGALIALLSIAVCFVMHYTRRIAEKFVKNDYIRVVVGGCIVIALTFLLGTTDYNGAGGSVIIRALAGDAEPAAFALKLIFTAITLGMGFKGGEIVPIFFIGATFGCTVAPFLGISSTFGAALGLIALFCGVTNCPLAAIVLSIELFGGQAIPLFALASAVAYLLSGCFGLYSEQKIIYSKLNFDFIDKRLHL